MEKIKLVWEFFGTDANRFAEHHKVHLEEFIKLRNEQIICNYEIINESFAIAYLVVPKDKMKEYRDLLKPHKGFIVE